MPDFVPPSPDTLEPEVSSSFRPPPPDSIEPPGFDASDLVKLPIPGPTPASAEERRAAQYYRNKDFGFQGEPTGPAVTGPLKTAPLRAIGTALHTASGIPLAVAEDLINYIPGSTGPKYSHGENVAATLMQEPRPYEEGIDQMGMPVRIPFEIAKGAASFFAPMKALSAVEKGAKITGLLGRSLTSAGVFGTGSEGIDPQHAFVAGLFPGASTVGEKLAVKIAADLSKKKLVAFTDETYEAIKQAGRFAATQAVMEGSSVPTYIDPKIPLKEKIVLFATNLGMNLGLHIPGVIQAKENSKAIQASIDESIRTSADLVAQVGAQPMIPEGRERLAAKFLPEAESHRGEPLSRRLRVAGRPRATIQPKEPDAITEGPKQADQTAELRGGNAQLEADRKNRADNAAQLEARTADSASGNRADSGTKVAESVTPVTVLGPGTSVAIPEPAKPQKTREEFEAYHAKLRADKTAHITANLTAAGEAGAVELKSSNPHYAGNRLVIAPDATKPGVWRVTHLMEDGPWGHYEFPSRESAIRAASGESGTALVKGPSYYSYKDWTVSRVSSPVKVEPKAQQQKLLGAPATRKLLGPVGTPQEIRRNRRAIRLSGAPEPQVAIPLGDAPVVEAEATKPTKGIKKDLYLKPRADGVPDILDAIQEEGGIKSPKQSKFADKGDYDGYAEAFNYGAASVLRRNKGGTAPDELVQLLITNHGFQRLTSTGDLYDAVKKASELRDSVEKPQFAPERVVTKANKAEFLKAILQNKGKNKGQTAVRSKQVSQLAVGDVFEIKGQEVRVADINPDTDARVLDAGPKYGIHELTPDLTVYPDKSTYVPAERSTEFLPVGEQGMPSPNKALVAPIDFNQIELSQSSGIDLGAALAHYAENNAGYNTKLGKSPPPLKDLGVSTRVHVMKLKLWEDMTPEERLQEFKDYALRDFQRASEEATNPVEYMLDRALDPLDPMAVVYQGLLKKRGAAIRGDGKQVQIKLSKELDAQRKKELSQGEQGIPSAGDSVVAVASRLGKVVKTGTTHFEAETKLREELGITSTDDPRVERIQHGFLDNKGNFLSRERAWKVAEKAQQIKGSGYEPGYLGGEDLKPREQGMPSDSKSELRSFLEEKMSTPDGFRALQDIYRHNVFPKRAPNNSGELMHFLLGHYLKNPEALETDFAPAPKTEHPYADYGEQGAPRFTPDKSRKPETAVGVENIRRLIDNPDSGLSPEAQQVALAWLRQPVFHSLDWSKLAVSIQDSIQGGKLAGTANVAENLVRLAREGPATALPHELTHFLYELLPPAERRIVEMLRQEAIDRAIGVISTATGATASQRTTLEAMRPDGQRASLEAPREFYHLQNGSEFLAHLGSERFEREISALKAAEGKPLKQFMLKIRGWLADLMDGIRKVLGKNPTLDRIHKDLLAGKYESRPSDSTTGEQGMLAANKKQAERILAMGKTRGARAERLEASEIQGQVGFPVRKLAEVAFADPVFNTLDPKAASAVLLKLGHRGLEDIQNEATRIVPRGEYLAAKAALPADIWPDYQKQVGERFKILEDRLIGVESEHDKLVKRMNTQTYLRRVQKANFQGGIAAGLEVMKGHFEGEVSRALAQGVKIMRAEAQNLGGAEVLLKDIESLETKREYKEAVKSAMADIVRTLSRTEAGIELLMTINPASVPAILQRYSLLRNVSTPNQIVLQWAAQTMARATDTVKELVAFTLLKDNQKARDQYNSFASKFADDFAKNPFATARQIVSSALELGKDAERARLAFKALNKDLVRDAKDLEILETSKNIARQFLDDAETVAYKKDVYGTVIQDRPKGTEEQGSAIRLEEGITLPDGSNTGPITLYGDAKQMAGELSIMEQAANKIAFHIVNNPDSTTAQYWQVRLDELQNILTTSRMLTPTRFIKPGGYEGAPFSPLGMTKHYVDSLGTREASRLKVSLANHSRAIELVLNLLRENFPKTSLRLLSAAQSHGFEVGRRPNEAVHLWYREIGNALYSSWQHPEGGKMIGDWIRGHQVTAQDFEMLKHTSSVTSRAYEIIQKGLPKERPGLVPSLYFRTELGPNGVPIWVQATKPSELTVTRVFDQDARRFMESWIDPRNQTPEAKLKLLTDNFWNIVQRYLADRAPIYFKGESPYEAAYKQITQHIDRNGLAYSERNMDWLIEQLHQITNVPKDKLTADFLLEFGDSVKILPERILKKESGTEIESLEQRNAFSQARTPQLAGDWLYKHGFNDSNALINLLMGATGHFYQRAAEDMLRVKVDLERQQREMQQKIAKLVNRGESPRASRAHVIEQQEAETKRYSPVRLEGSLDTYTELDRKIKQTDQLIQLFNDVYGSRGQNVEFDIGRLQRVIGAQTSGVLSSYLVALRNLGTGWNYLGRQMNLITGNVLGGSAKGFRYVWLDALPKYTGSAVVSLAKSVTKIPEGVRSAVASHRRGDSKRIQLVRLMEPMLQEMTQTMYERVKMQKELFDRGYAAPTYTVEDMMAKLSMLSEGGAIREKELFSSTAGQLGFGLLTLYDALILTPIGKPFLPRFADLTLNHAAMKASFDALEVLEQQLRKVHQTYSDIQKTTGTGRFDFNDPKNPINELAADEVFGKWFGKERTNTDREHLRAWFEYGTIGYQEAAMRFLGELEKGNTKAKLLTPDEAYTLGNALAEETNKASAINRTLLFKKGGLWQFVAPLLGFNLNLWASRVRSLSRAAVDPDSSKLMMWLKLGLGAGVAAAITNALSDVTTEMIARVLYQNLLGEERATRLPWEREGVKSKGIGWALAMINPEPFISILANSLINDMPSRASYNPDLFLMGKFKDVLNYASGVAQSGDFTYGLGRLLKGTLPVSSTIINQLPGVEGLVEGSNARRLLRRFGPQDLLRPPDRGISPGQAGVVTPLSPLVQRAYNAAIRGDTEGLAQAKAEYVATATRLGLPNPEQRLAQALQGRDAFRSVFRVVITDEQKEAILSKMSPAQRATVENVESKIDAAVQSIKGSAPSRTATGGRATSAGSAVAEVFPSSSRAVGGRTGSSGIRARRIGRGRSRIGRRIGLRKPRGIARVRGYNLASRTRRQRRRKLSIAA